MMTRPTIQSLTVILVALMASLSVSEAQLSPPRGGKERLVPGNYGELNDSKGHRWSVQQSGVINRGSNSFLSNCAQLHINNQQFYNHQSPMMTSDRKEYVIEHQNPSQLGGLRVTRRIRVMEKEGCLRFLEIFENPTGQAISTNAEVRHQLGTQYKEYYTEQGTKDAGSFGKKESGIYLIPGSNSSSYKPVMFTICAPGAKAKPRFLNQNKYTLHFHFQLTIPAGQTAAIMHTIAQPGKTTDFSAKNLTKMFKDSSFKTVLKSVPAALRSRVVNFSSGGAFGNLSMLASTTVDGLGVDRGKSDILALGESSRMIGTASCGELRLQTDYGEAVVPFEQVAAFVGGNHGRRKVSRIFLRDGQVYTGAAQASDLRLVMADGTKMKLTVESLDRLVRKEASGEGKWGEGVGAMLETFSGDRIAVSDGSAVMLDAVTPWGPIRFSLDDVLWLSPPEDEPVGHHIEFKDGSRFFAYLVGGTVKIGSELFGSLELDTGEVRSVVTTGMLAKMKEVEASGGAMVMGYDDTLQVPHVILSGGQRIIGRVAAPTLGVVTNAELIEIPPDTVRLMHSLRGEHERSVWEQAPFSIELWGGSRITGHIKEAVLPVMVREQIWRIPLGDVVDVVSPTPRISDETRQRIAALISDLGNKDWETREGATEEVGEYGYMAKALLIEALKMTPDAEVRRRIEQLLSEMP